MLAIFTMLACRGIYENSSEMAQAYRSEILEVNVEELTAKIEAGEEFLLIDIRQPNDYYTENIPGSVLIPRGQLEFMIGSDDYWMEQYMYPPEKDSEIIIYCNDGDFGVLAAKSLQQLGYSHVLNLSGGYRAYNPNQDPDAKPKTPAAGCGS